MSLLYLLLGKVCKNECAFLRRELVLLLSGLLQQLFPHHSEDRTQKRPPKDLSGLVAGQAVTELRNIAVAEPSETSISHNYLTACNCTGAGKAGTRYLSTLLPSVVDFVSSCVVIGHPLASLRGRFQLPVVDLVEKHLSQLHNGLAFFRWQVAEFVLDKIVHPLFQKRGVKERTNTSKVRQRSEDERVCAVETYFSTCSMLGFSNGGLSCASNIGLPICRMDFLSS